MTKRAVCRCRYIGHLLWAVLQTGHCQSQTAHTQRRIAMSYSIIFHSPQPGHGVSIAGSASRRSGAGRPGSGRGACMLSAPGCVR
jgi:hypothetical protein